MPRRSLGDVLGVYRRDGRVRFGRAPYLTDADRERTRNPGRTTRVLQRIGLVYAPDGTRRRLFGGRTRD
ncbi:hypothetical protein [Nocardioides alkalitolerans]|uniref:hypothetical protein n=1 Tax=Nocardioides alkalitolerans TaxID=281714 RepID=UPI000410E273|nr:hypothetical protein [Nocardioides alkalitolerans]